MFDIYRVQDMNLEDVTLKANYYKEFLNGDLNKAHEIYKTNPQLNGKVLNAELLNQLLSSILTLESYYDTSVTKQFLSELDRFQVNINELIYMRDYSNTESYRVNNFVLYNEDIYFCFNQPPIGVLPTNNTYWIYLGLKGEKGTPAINISYKGVWNVATNYVENDMVTYRNELYIVTVANVGVLPTDTTRWFKALDVEKRGMFYGETEPPELTDGDIWVKVI